MTVWCLSYVSLLCNIFPFPTFQGILEEDIVDAIERDDF